MQSDMFSTGLCMSLHSMQVAGTQPRALGNLAAASWQLPRVPTVSDEAGAGPIGVEAEYVVSDIKLH